MSVDKNQTYKDFVEGVLFLHIGDETRTDNSINSWSRAWYDKIAIIMGLNPKLYKNKKEIHTAMGAELPYFLETQPKIKKILQLVLQRHPNNGRDHCLYPLLFN